MVILDVTLAVVIGSLAAATTCMAIVGGLALLGILRYERCPSCAHLARVAEKGSPQRCTHCAHHGLFHPIDAVHELHLWHRAAHPG